MVAKRIWKLVVMVLSATALSLIVYLLYIVTLMSIIPQYDPEWRPLDIAQYKEENDISNFKTLKEAILRKNEVCNNKIVPPTQERIITLNKVWQLAKDSNSQIAIFGAYYDTRPNILKYSVRILAVSTARQSKNTFCQLWYKNITSPLIIKADSKDTGRGLGLYGMKYQERLYTCVISTKLLIPPQSVSMVFAECENSTTLVPVNLPSPKQTHDFGICVVVAYGMLDPVALVEWIEFNRILGVGEINIYDSRLDQVARNIFQHYQKLGVVNIQEAAPPMNNWCTWCQKLAVIPALNDCMYRNMFRYKHMVVIDFDEFIIPKEKLFLSSLISYLRSTWKDEPASYMFRNAYFFKDFPVNSSQPNYLITNKYLTRTEPSRQWYAPKSIVNPRRCIVMQNHYCMIRTPDVPSQYSLHVKPELALNHHYKKCHLKKPECETHLKHPILDKTALKFKRPLNFTVYNKITELKLMN